MAETGEKILKETESKADNTSRKEEEKGNTESVKPNDKISDKQKMAPDEKIKTLEAELAEAKAKAEEHFNRLQRLQAEFDNYRKRTLKEKTEIINYASEHLVAELLPVLDNFERAVSAAQKNADFASFSKGVEMILRQLQTALSKEGLKAIDVVGKPFDPNLHDAVLRVESDEHPENTVVEELQKGYYLKDKVLRPSMVKVSN